MIGKYVLRNCSKDYLQKKQEQYSDVATKVQKVIAECGYEESEESFELAKKWILNNEQLSIIQGIGDAIRELLEYVVTWIPIVVTFVLGVLTTILSNDSETIFSKNTWVFFLLIVSIGFIFELLIKTMCIRTEKYSVRIIKEMTYGEYKLLLSYEDNNKKEKSGKESEDA